MNSDLVEPGFTGASDDLGESVDMVLGWKGLDEVLLPKIMWENAVKCFGKP